LFKGEIETYTVSFSLSNFLKEIIVSALINVVLEWCWSMLKECWACVRLV